MRKRRRFTLVLLIILSFNFFLVSAFDASSSSYSINSYNTGIAGGNLSSLSYDSKFSLQYQQGVADGESPSYRSTIGWFFTSFCGDRTCDAEETCSSCSADCGSCPSAETPATTAAPSGGGGAGCAYDWVCSEWYPEPCPSEGIQKRVCVNRGTCNGISGMPELEKNCIPSFVSPAEPLFDIFLRVPLLKKWISKGDFMDADVELVNVGNTTKIDVFFKYWIVDENNRLILEKQETRAIGEYEKFTLRFPLSKDIKTGIYKIYAHISYDDGKVALAGDSFEVFQSRFVMIMRIALISLGILLGIIGLIFLINRIFRRKISLKKEKPKRIAKREHEKIEMKKVSIFDFFVKLKNKMQKERMKRIEFKEKIKRIRQQREAGRRMFIEKQERLQRMKEAKRRTYEEKRKLEEERERRLSEQRIARRKTLEENRRMEEKLREERRRAYRERKMIKERLNRKPERKRNTGLFNFHKKKKSSRKKKKKFIHLTLTRGGHEEKVRLEE